MNTTTNAGEAGNNQSLVPVSEKVTGLLSKETLNPDDLNLLTKEEQQQFNLTLASTINQLKGDEKDSFLQKMEPVLSENIKSDIWEANHLAVTRAINKGLSEWGRMPTKTEIAKLTGLSRLTVHKHIKEFNENPLFATQQEEFKLMKDRLMAMLYQLSMNRGNVNATRLFFEAAGLLGQAKPVNQNIIENQHNYIQINETRLSQDEIKKLSPERLKQIEELLKAPEKVV